VLGQLAAAGALLWRPPAAALEGVAVRMLVFGARAPAALGKLRSSVLARRHAPATPESTTGRGARRRASGRARGRRRRRERRRPAAKEREGSSRPHRRRSRRRRSAQKADRRIGHAVAWALFTFRRSPSARGRSRARCPAHASACSRPGATRAARVDGGRLCPDVLARDRAHAGVTGLQAARATRALLTPPARWLSEAKPLVRSASRSVKVASATRRPGGDHLGAKRRGK